MSEDYFFDTYAIIEIIKGNPNYEFFKDNVIVTGAMNIAEVYYALLLENTEEFADLIIKKLNVQIIEISQDISINAAKFRYKHKKLFLSYVDCIGYILAKENNLIFLTGDEGFKNMDNVKLIKK
ncbi:MAG: PIN domain-containing protein [Candidatus Nanoarchaeia archaeon]|nr:PIN domain-containing protein [Candidatus Nanoarchaeia archaeon]MDD5741541.1 PIN domain-containing protein [Candidatus Nanoarchaeia archaeon]